MSLPAGADVLEIDLTGLEFEYEANTTGVGGTLEATEDELTAAVFELNDVVQGFVVNSPGGIAEVLATLRFAVDEDINGPDDDVPLSSTGTGPNDLSLTFVEGGSTYVLDLVMSAGTALYAFESDSFSIQATGSVVDSTALPFGLDVAAGNSVTLNFAGDLDDVVVDSSSGEVLSFSVDSVSSLVVVPEPASLAFAAVGLGLIARRRRA